VTVRLSGTFSDTRSDIVDNAQSTFTTPVLSILNPRVGKQDINDGGFNAKITHVLNPQIFYEVSGGLFIQTLENYDPSLKDDFWSYGDSVANANAGWVWSRSAKDTAFYNGSGLNGSQTRFFTPSIRNIMGFSFNGYGEVPVNYQKRDRKGYSINGALTMFAGKEHTIQGGGEFQQNRYG
jgi:hypothetical protein